MKKIVFVMEVALVFFVCSCKLLYEDPASPKGFGANTKPIPSYPVITAIVGEPFQGATITLIGSNFSSTVSNFIYIWDSRAGLYLPNATTTFISTTSLRFSIPIQLLTGNSYLLGVGNSIGETPTNAFIELKIKPAPVSTPFITSLIGLNGRFRKGEIATVSGGNFAAFNVNDVWFYDGINTNFITQTSSTYLNSSRISFTIPADLSSGTTYYLGVFNNTFGTTAADGRKTIFITSGASTSTTPVINSFTSGDGLRIFQGSSITINGTNFSSFGNTVYVYNFPSDVNVYVTIEATYISPTKLKIIIPNTLFSFSSYYLGINNAAFGTTLLTDRKIMYINFGTPAVESSSPVINTITSHESSFYGESTITIKGSNFSNSLNWVYFYSSQSGSTSEAWATASVNTSSQIVVDIPPNLRTFNFYYLGVYNHSTGFETLSANRTSLYLSAGTPYPVLSSLSHNNGSGFPKRGSSVTITGTKFSATNTNIVYFYSDNSSTNATASAVGTSTNGTTLRFTVPTSLIGEKQYWLGVNNGNKETPSNSRISQYFTTF